MFLFNVVQRKPAVNESGVTMLLAIFLLTSMISIAALAVPLLNAEISSSYTAQTSEQLFYKAHGESEFNMFFLMHKRTDLAYIPTCSASNRSSGVEVGDCQTYYYGNPYVLVVPANKQTNLYLIDPSNPNTETGPHLSSIVIANLAGSNITVGSCLVTDSGACSDSVSIAPGYKYTNTFTSGNDSPVRRQIQLDNSSGSASTNVMVTLNCQPDSTLPCAIPAGTNILYNSANFNGIRRYIRTVLP